MELWNFECSYVKRTTTKNKKHIEYVQLDSGIRLDNVNTYPIDYWCPY